MTFQQFWARLQGAIRPGLSVPKWSAFHGYLGDTFAVGVVSSTSVSVEPPQAENAQHVPKRDSRPFTRSDLHTARVTFSGSSSGTFLGFYSASTSLVT